ncbi:MAG: hypothetical protein K4571_04925 [Deltaproteobacteria bacterium]
MIDLVDASSQGLFRFCTNRDGPADKQAGQKKKRMQGRAQPVHDQHPLTIVIQKIIQEDHDAKMQAMRL